MSEGLNAVKSKEQRDVDFKQAKQREIDRSERTLDAFGRELNSVSPQNAACASTPVDPDTLSWSSSSASSPIESQIVHVSLKFSQEDDIPGIERRSYAVERVRNAIASMRSTVLDVTRKANEDVRWAKEIDLARRKVMIAAAAALKADGKPENELAALRHAVNSFKDVKKEQAEIVLDSGTRR